MDRLNAILEQFGNPLGLALHADRNRACALQVRPGLVVQLQSDPTGEFLILGAQIAEIPPGKFRENVLKEALKANNQPGPLAGQLAYIAQINHLFLFQRYPFDMMTGNLLAQLLGPFTQTVTSWKEALSAGHPGPTSFAPAPLGGLRP